MNKENFESFFNPSSIAVVGASSKAGKIGTSITDNLLKLGYKGKVFLVNPSYNFLRMRYCYPKLSEIKEKIDVAIIVVPAKLVKDVILDGADNVKNFVVISAGFAETGREGSDREKELALIAKQRNVNILGPNCLGYIIPKLKLNASFAPDMPSEGNIALISQSGALAVAFLDRAKNEHIGFSNMISVGNKMEIDESQLLDYLANDNDTKVIGMYLEGIKDGAKFMVAAKKASSKKPVVILKAGKTEKSQKAISSHTGALAGSDEIIDAAFESCGIIRASDLEEFFSLLELISLNEVPQNDRVAVVTNAGGAGVLATDAFKGKKLMLADLSEESKDALRALLPAESSVENPIDLLGDAKEDRYKNALGFINGTGIGSVICLLTPQEQTPVEKIAKVIIDSKKQNKNCLVSVFIGGKHVESSIAMLKKNGISNFDDPDKAVYCLNKYYAWNEFKNREAKAGKTKVVAERKKEVLELISYAQKNNRTALLYNDAMKVMEKYCIPCAQSFFIREEDAGIPEIKDYPVVLKVDSDKVLHKTDKQALLLNIKDEQMLKSSIAILRQNFPGEQLLVQPMLNAKTELILGIKKDEIFGPVIVFGLGGIYTEIFKMVDFLLPPMSFEEIKEKVGMSKLGFLFRETRGQNPYDLDELSKILFGLMEFAMENKDIVKEFDINPLMIFNDGKGAKAVDIKIIF